MVILEAALVFDPPSNIRSSPNEAILCAVRSRVYVNVYGKVWSVVLN
jgi:hypothetical protein